jgi:hypothetical protein
VRELELVLGQMLRTGQDLAARYQRGQLEEARAGLDQVNSFSNKIENLLSGLEYAA